MQFASRNISRILFRFLIGLSALVMYAIPSGHTWARPSAQSAECDYYVDNEASYDGSGSWSTPWKSVSDHVGDLAPGDTMCVRGDASGSGRVYDVREIYLNSREGSVRDGLSGAPITVRPYPGEKVILRNIGSSSILYLKGADYWILEGFVMDHNGRDTYAIRFKYGANHNILRDNEIRNGRSNAITFYSGSNVDNLIENNHIHHFNGGDSDAHCVALTPGSNNIIIRGNLIHDCSGDGIQLDAVDDTPIGDYSKDVQIIGNVLFRGGLPRSEDGIDLKGADGVTITDNELHGYHYDTARGVAGRAIVIQKGSRDILLERNVFHDLGAGIDIHGEGGKRPEQVTIRNNLFHDINIDGRYAIALNYAVDVVLHHNTIANSHGCSICVWRGGLRGGDLRNNLVYDSDKASLGTDAVFLNVTLGYNGWFDTSSDFIMATDVVRSGNPGFESAASDDYHLTSGSLVRDVGIAVGVYSDFEGESRPFGSRPDIGADEYVPKLKLTPIPQDGAIRLIWAPLQDPNLVDYAITYTYRPGGRNAAQGPSPLVVPSTVHSMLLTGLPNYVLYTFAIAARDGSGADLVVSGSVVQMPTDLIFYAPLIVKSRW